MDGRKGAADILAKLVHSDINPGSDVEESLNKVPDDEEEDINVDDFGIWIDPIGMEVETIKKDDLKELMISVIFLQYFQMGLIITSKGKMNVMQKILKIQT